MCTSIILILSVGLSIVLAQNTQYFPSAPGTNNWQSPNPSSQYQPYRAPTSSPSASGVPSLGSYQTSPQLSTISQLSGYNRLPAIPQSNPWAQYAPGQSGARSWSIPTPLRSYPSSGMSQSPGLSGYTRPTPLASPVSAQAPTQFQGTPFQTTFSVNHQTAAPAQSRASFPTQPQPYSVPSPVASPPTQSWSQPSTQSWSTPPTQSWSPPPTQSWSQPPAPVSQWRPAPAQTYSAPRPAPVQSPVSQWTPPPTQTYRAPAPVAPQQTAPQSAPATTSYQSPQNSQNYRPAPVHYADIGPQLQGDYKFGYHTGDGGSFREETRLPDGTVQGAYGFIDTDGKQRIVRYRAGKDGFQAEGDDVPKGTPAAADGASAPSSPSSPSAPINVDEGAAFRSFSQG